MKWYVGSDHAGYEMKESLAEFLRGSGDTVEDLGTTSAVESVDYPDFGAAVAKKVASDEGALGLLVCGTGIGISIAANKIAGARAALVHDVFSAGATRAHNDANIIAFGSRVIGQGLAQELLKTFRESSFEGGRHQRRLDKILALEKAQN